MGTLLLTMCFSDSRVYSGLSTGTPLATIKSKRGSHKTKYSQDLCTATFVVSQLLVQFWPLSLPLLVTQLE